MVGVAMITFFSIPCSIKDGFFKGMEWDLDKSEVVGEEYCALRGCDPDTGLPTQEELERLGLEGLSELLEEQE